jgi:hypothetical protein
MQQRGPEDAVPQDSEPYYTVGQPQWARPPQPGYGQQPQPQYAPYQPPQTPKKKHYVRNALAAVFAMLVGIVILITAMSSTKTTSTPAALAPATPAPSGSHRPGVAPTVVLTESGNGQLTTKPFTVAADWSLTYTFNCSAYGEIGNFITYVDYPSGGSITNALAMSGGATTYQTDDAGTHSLTVSTECAWTIKVTSGD